MMPETPTRPGATRLAASRAATLCGLHGLAAAFRRAGDAGLVEDYDRLDDLLEAILEGDEDDVLDVVGWRPCRRLHRCRRAGRCLRQRR